MTQTSDPPIRAETLMGTNGIRYSICTLVTRPAEYDEMRRSFQSKGFDSPDCEYLYLDNSASNAHDAYTGLNLFLTVARGERIILCHQDVLLLEDGRAELDRALDELTRRDPTWAVVGNSGGRAPGDTAIRITDPHGTNQRIGSLPAQVGALDENFLLVRRDANLALSWDMAGFHLYGTDLCVLADVLGRSAYVIDFHLHHKSAGTRDQTLEASRRMLVAKYRRGFRSRYITAPCEIMFMSGVSWLSLLLNAPLVSRLVYRSAKRAPGLMGAIFRPQAPRPAVRPQVVKPASAGGRHDQ